MCMRLWFLLLIHSEFVRRKLFLDIVLATLFQFILSFDHLAAQRLIKFIGLPSFCFVPKTDSKSAKNKLTTPAQNWEKNTTDSLSNGLFNCFNALSRSHTQTYRCTLLKLFWSLSQLCMAMSHYRFVHAMQWKNHIWPECAQRTFSCIVFFVWIGFLCVVLFRVSPNEQTI